MVAQLIVYIAAKATGISLHSGSIYSSDSLHPETMDDILTLSTTSLRIILKQALEVLIEQGGYNTLTVTVCKELLREVQELSLNAEPDTHQSQTFEGGLSILAGYPNYPLYHRLADSLSYWMTTGNCPVHELPMMFMLNEGDSIDERQEKLEAAGSPLSGSYSLWNDWSEDEQKYTLLSVLKNLELRGVLDLLGIRCTVGSSSLLPPPKEVLLTSFIAPHHPSAKLSVGGRALSKHSHRDDTQKWWGVCTGSEEAKNKHALKLCLRVLRQATWINIHSLPHEVKVIEIRTIEGYGVRWLHDGSEFRGFLEPQMEDGHSVGWRH